MKEYEGSWKDDEFHGEGKITWEIQNGQTRTFVGEFENGIPGKGDFTYENGDTVTARWNGDEWAWE